MILDDKGAQIAADAVDAPPAYDELSGAHSASLPSGQKTPNGPGRHPPQAQAGPPNATATRAYMPSGSTKTWLSWFSEKDTRIEVKRTIQSLMRDVVKDPASPAAVSVLQSCLEACQSRGLSFQSIVSEKFIEGHCPLYWAIIKRPATSSEDDDDRVQLFDILLSIPLDSTTRSEAYLACMLSSDQVLFQRLRHTPGDHSPSVSPAHELLLGDTPKDDVRSVDRGADYGEFRINWKISKFQQRMRAIGGVGTEVIARGRIWSLALSILPRDTYISGSLIQAGAWVASVSLLEPSPPTYLDAQFSIQEPPKETPPSGVVTSPLASPTMQPPHNPDDHVLPSTQTRKTSFAPWSNLHKTAAKPPITLRVKTSMCQLEALPLRSKKQDLRDHVLSQPGSKTLIVPLGGHVNGNSLQYDGCSYIHRDGTLLVTFDGRLTKPGTGGDCIIC
ncbi:hypothetical protein JB92DRAFT_2923183 [Gautieria morchelliformis]|nr:hypothetical protein JB92DRAFT_2923183 [Gautieria morchelliformis]